jgi:hypothetical protein
VVTADPGEHASEDAWGILRGCLPGERRRDREGVFQLGDAQAFRKMAREQHGDAEGRGDGTLDDVDQLADIAGQE